MTSICSYAVFGSSERQIQNKETWMKKPAKETLLVLKVLSTKS